MTQGFRSSMSVVALMTDFGTRDHYVAAMKGVILQINPKAVLVDITHEIEPHQVADAAFVLRQVFPCYPENTVFVAVVDPTVGTGRRILTARYSGRYVVAPDNGILTFVHRDAELQEIRVVDNRMLMASTISNTFHGRDIMAPVAGHLSKGLPMDRFGPVADRIEALKIPRPAYGQDGAVDGQVLYIDRFGNLITNISALDLAAGRSNTSTHHVLFGSRPIGPVRDTYADVPSGELLALVGSTQMLEIAANSGSAAAILDAHRGDPVRVRL
ncbi:MAG TPA: SAM-dependent chlorinase/fluorinase [Phycisphaerae bacterium]|nr:SAM-dependent chlorinase/fluorinase [Phycisphaerae bacterium]